MIRLAVLLSILMLFAVMLLVASDDWSFSLFGPLAAVAAMVGFAVVAAGWTIRHDT
jgi:hypothetical protein